MDPTTRVRWMGVAAMAGGLLWAVAPYPVRSIEARVVNLIYLLPLGLLAIGVLGFQEYRPNIGRIGVIGYVLSMAAMMIAAVGALLEAVFSPVRLLQLGLGGGFVFLLGFYLLLVGAALIGIGFWRTDPEPRLGTAILLATPPVAIVGFYLLDQSPWDAYEWAAFTVPYGLAWIVLGYHVWSRHGDRSDPNAGRPSAPPNAEESPEPSEVEP